MDKTHSRRTFLGKLATGTLALGASVLPNAHAAQPAQIMSPDEALGLLKEGNRAFLAGKVNPEAASAERRLEIARGQHPFAVLVGCSDSRVSPEILFERQLGELFIVRNAGNTVEDFSALGSIEYAVLELGVPLILVLGHEKCGAVDAAVSIVTENTEFPGSIGAMVEPILPAVLAVRNEPGDLLDNAVRENVRRVVARLKTSDALLSGPMAEGRLKIVGARYDLDTGEVDFSVA